MTRPAPVLGRRIATGEGAHAFCARGHRRQVFVSNRVANTISLIDMQARVAGIAPTGIHDQLAGEGGRDRGRGQGRDSGRGFRAQRWLGPMRVSGRA